MKQLNVQSDR